MNPETQFFWLTPSLLQSHYTDNELFSHIRTLKVTNKLGRVITFWCQPTTLRTKELVKSIYATDAVDFPNDRMWIGHLRFAHDDASRREKFSKGTETWQDLWRLRVERGRDAFADTRGRMVREVMDWTLWYLQQRKDPPTGYTILVKWTNDVL